MRALLRKDFYVLWRQMKLLAVIYVAFAVCPQYYFQLFAVVYAALLPYSAIACDEQSHWDTLAGMMPYSVRDLVLSKYLLGWIAALASTLVAIAAGIVERPFFQQAARPGVMLIALSISVLAIALSLPFMFCFGSARGRQLMSLALIVFTCICASLLSSLLGDETFSMLPGLTVVAPVIAVAVTAASIPVSMALYRRRHR